ncbi:50S ribosomal protein L3 [Candidatus Riesia pediculicola]|uniref:Large ribosomal subunit protein uL3 n=1 Tax=Riesia pediculicola (strain USDA) TaxID=515618 RepID=D4G8N4_RIEPU|nr:50S ribosomal protein L3 [Candidatus Riesia pediculicola]ADD79736.1 ribosomal protein L3 [Candidatus Riesia pediculicola USDA]QOJ86542.1 50S ribosomal protein L3 [Candidatus Riesia pediculicola]
MIGLIGKKIGMTRIFMKNGMAIPITVIQVEENRVTQVGILKKNGYRSVQVTSGIKKHKFLKSSEIGFFKKIVVDPGKILKEFKTNATNENYHIGQKIHLSFLSKFKRIDISSFSKGKGFCGTIKRWNFKAQDASHGNSLSHRVPGSIGQNQTPGRVFKGKKMAGHMGNKKVTMKKLEIIQIDEKKGLILVKGSVPGGTNCNLIIKPTV